MTPGLADHDPVELLARRQKDQGFAGVLHSGSEAQNLVTASVRSLHDPASVAGRCPVESDRNTRVGRVRGSAK